MGSSPSTGDYILLWCCQLVGRDILYLAILRSTSHLNRPHIRLLFRVQRCLCETVDYCWIIVEYFPRYFLPVIACDTLSPRTSP